MMVSVLKCALCRDDRERHTMQQVRSTTWLLAVEVHHFEGLCGQVRSGEAKVSVGVLAVGGHT